MTHLLAMLSTMEIIALLAVALLIFGATKLPKLARSMGRSVGEFKAGLKDPPQSDTSGVTPEREPAASEKT